MECKLITNVWFVLTVIFDLDNFMTEGKYFAGYLHSSNTSFHANVANTSTKTTSVEFSFSITFPKPDNNHCPIIYLRYPGFDHNYNVYKGCFERSHIERNVKFDSHFWWFENCGSEDLPKVCSLDNETNNVSCSDTLEISHGMSQYWFVSVGYICGQEQVLDISYNMSLKNVSTDTCIPFKHSNTFHKRCMIFNYTHYSKVNIFGWQEKKSNLLMSTWVETLQSVMCHQHVLELACRTLFPECNSKTMKVVTTPCRRMCLDVLEGCTDLFKDGIVTHCSPFADTLDPEICIYRQVLCSLPLPPLHGGIRYPVMNITNQSLPAGMNITYYCDRGFTPADEMNATCMLSGRWNKSGPTCVFSWEHNVKHMLHMAYIPISLNVVLLICLILIIAYFKGNKLIVWCIIRHNIMVKPLLKIFKCSFQKPAPYKFNAFVSYSQYSNEDILFVRQKVIDKIPNGRFFTHDNVLPGEREVSVIEKALLSECAAFIFLLTEDNLQLPETKVYFQIAQTRHSEDSMFKFIIISFDNNVNDIEFEQFLEFGTKFGFVHNIYYNDTLLAHMIETALNLDML